MEKKCETCRVNQRVAKSKEPACCVWFLNNVVILGKSAKDCPDYEPIKGKKKKNKKS